MDLMCLCVYLSICAYVDVHTRVCVYVCMYEYVCTCVWSDFSTDDPVEVENLFLGGSVRSDVKDRDTHGKTCRPYILVKILKQ